MDASRTPAAAARPELAEGAPDVRDYALSHAPFVTPKVQVASWFPTLGAFLDAYDADARYALVVDGDPATYVAHDVRLGTETNDAEHPLLAEPPATTLDGRLDFLTDDGAEEGVDLLVLRAIGLVVEDEV